MLKPLIELIVAGALWGFSFTASVWTLKFLDTPALLVYRFLGASGLGLALLLLFHKVLSPKILLGGGEQNLWQTIKSEGKTAWIPGACLFAVIGLQTSGLVLTTATKSAFITTLYVVIVPILSHLIGLERIKPQHILCVFLALFGLALFQDLQVNNWNFGDTLTLCAAIASAFHILSMAKYAPRSKSPFILNLWQLFWTGFLALFFLPFSERNSLSSLDQQGVIGLISLIVGSSLIAFYLQVRAQEKIPPNLASLMFLLESPFSALFAYYLLHENFSQLQWMGGSLILGACVVAVLTSGKKHRQIKKA